MGQCSILVGIVGIVLWLIQHKGRLGQIAFHDVPGISSGGLGFPLTLVHPSV